MEEYKDQLELATNTELFIENKIKARNGIHDFVATI